MNHMETADTTTSESLSEAVLESYGQVEGWVATNLDVMLRVVVILVVAWITVRISTRVLSNVLRKTIRKDMYPTKLDREKRIKTLNSISGAVIRFFVWLVAGFMILDAIGVNTAPIIASAGILGVALGFGTQSLVKDFMSGLFIIVENQYRVGDFIEVQNVSGTVESISMRTTTLRDVDGSVHTVPNGSITVSTNKTMGAGHTVLDLTFSAETDLHVVENVINEVGKNLTDDPKLSKMITDPPHFMRISEFTDKGVIVKVSSTTASGKQLEIKSAFLSKLQQELKNNDIKLISAATSKSKK